MKRRGVHDDLVWHLASGFRTLGYDFAVELHCRHVGRADLLVTRGIFDHWGGTADATVEVKTRLDAPCHVRSACRQVLRYANTWRRLDGRISIPFVVAATDRVHPDAAEWARLRGVHLLDGTNYVGALAVIAGMIGTPTRLAEQRQVDAEFYAECARNRAEMAERVAVIVKRKSAPVPVLDEAVGA